MTVKNASNLTRILNRKRKNGDTALDICTEKQHILHKEINKLLRKHGALGKRELPGYEESECDDY